MGLKKEVFVGKSEHFHILETLVPSLQILEFSHLKAQLGESLSLSFCEGMAALQNDGVLGITRTCERSHDVLRRTDASVRMVCNTASINATISFQLHV